MQRAAWQASRGSEAGNAADVLADVLPELTSEVSGIESAFGDIQAANVGLKDQADTLKDQYLRLNADFTNFKKRTLKERSSSHRPQRASSS